MKDKEESLSEYGKCINDSIFHAKHCPNEECERIYPEDKLKEAVRRLKKDIKEPIEICDGWEVIRIINEIFGDKLICKKH